MPLRPEDVPSDPSRLVAMVLALDAENDSLRAIVRSLKDLLFGARSERAAVIDVAQLPLDLDDLAVGPTPPPPPARQRWGRDRAQGGSTPPAGGAQHRCSSQASAAMRGGDRARDHGLPLLLRCAASDRGGDARGSRRGPGLRAGEGDHHPEIRLPALRGTDRPSQEPAPPG